MTHAVQRVRRLVIGDLGVHVQRLIDLVDEYRSRFGVDVYLDVDYVRRNAVYASSFSVREKGSEHTHVEIVLRNGTAITADKLAYGKETKIQVTVEPPSEG